MRVLGIDLAAQPRSTAACEIEWSRSAATATTLEGDWGDERLLDAMRRAEVVGIDCPLGWPDDFVKAVAAHRRRGPWPGRDSRDVAAEEALRRRLRFRATDLFVQEEHGLRPLSVSTDRIGVTAMRCARLLDRLAAEGDPVDRDGSGKVVEVYPAGALKQWGLAFTRYKRREGLANLGALAADLLAHLPGLALDEVQRAACETSDHCFDALVCALVAHAAARGLTIGPPSADHRDRAAREGWIHLPTGGSLARLAAS